MPFGCLSCCASAAGVRRRAAGCAVAAGAACRAHAAGAACRTRAACRTGATVAARTAGAADTALYEAKRLGRDQVESYAERKGWTLAQAEKWLSPNLGYDPVD